MVDLYSMYGVNDTAKTGVRFQFGKESDSAWIEMKFAGRENPEYQNAIMSHAEKYKNAFMNKSKLLSKIEDDKMREDYARIFADTIFVAWEGFTYKGKAMPNTKQAFFDFIIKSDAFFNEITALASDVSNFQKEAETKN